MLTCRVAAAAAASWLQDDPTEQIFVFFPDEVKVRAAGRQQCWESRILRR